MKKTPSHDYSQPHICDSLILSASPTLVGTVIRTLGSPHKLEIDSMALMVLPNPSLGLITVTGGCSGHDNALRFGSLHGCLKDPPSPLQCGGQDHYQFYHPLLFQEEYQDQYFASNLPELLFYYE